MAVKSEITWKQVDTEGRAVHVCARRFGGEWQFLQRHSRRHEQWLPVHEPNLDHWLALLDGVRRRVPRGLFTPSDLDQIRRTIRERYPEAKIPLE